MTTFKDFVFGQMKAAGLKKSTWEPIYKVGFPYFQQAFTHESFKGSAFHDIHELRSMQFSMEELQTITSLKELDNMPSYEQLEFTGDKQINVCIAQHLTEKYPGLPAGNLTFSFQKLASEKYLARFGKKQGFFEHILLSPALYNQAILFRDGLPTEIDINFFQGGKIYDIYAKLVEDCVEAFAAALCQSINLYAESPFGPGMAILYTWTQGIMQEQDFDATDIDQIKAPGIQLREAWENIYAQRKDAAKKFSNNDMFMIDQTKRKPGYVPIKAINPVTRKVIAETVGLTEQDAKANAAILANDYIKAHFAKELEIGKAFKMQKRGMYTANNFIIEQDSDDY